MEEKKILTFEELMTGFARIEKMQEENAKGFARLEKMQEENAKGFAELRKQAADTRRDVDGIGESNGKFCETYFYNTLFSSMHFGGKDFDEIDKGLKRSKKLQNGKKITGEYDVVMYNGDTIALIEVKYKVRKSHIENLKTKQVSVFKELFPQYDKFNFYLGIAGLSFEDNAEKEALEQGIGILRPKGESVEIIDDNLKVY
ncbi:MAG: hypothetical protein FWF51_08805 [Chitinivibrionia bacterium]|nr:hypothetical protein [Chitinivibrionia bacterium]